MPVESGQRSFELEALEERTLLSADGGLGVLVGGHSGVTGGSAIEVRLEDNTVSNQGAPVAASVGLSLFDGIAVTPLDNGGEDALTNDPATAVLPGGLPDEFANSVDHGILAEAPPPTPVIDPIPDQVGNEDSPLFIPITVTDPDTPVFVLMYNFQVDNPSLIDLTGFDGGILATPDPFGGVAINLCLAFITTATVITVKILRSRKSNAVRQRFSLWKFRERNHHRAARSERRALPFYDRLQR